MILAFISYVLIEVCIRLFVWVHPVPMLFENNYNRFRGSPNAMIFGYPLNSHGFKDEEFEPKQKGVFRIVGIGDSFTFGVTPYPENFLTIAENELNKRISNPKIQIYNMGIPSIGPREEVALLADEGLSWQPDLVMINFFVGNDFQESIRSTRRKFVEKYSYTANILYLAYKMITNTSRDLRQQYKDGWTTYCDTCRVFSKEGYLELEADRSYIFHKGNDLFERQLSDVIVYIERARKMCQAKKCQLFVCIFPDEMQVSAELREEVIQRLKQRGETPEWDNSLPNRRLAEELTKLNIPHADLLPVFEKEKDSICYLPHDTHWNIRGNRLAGNFIADQLEAYIGKNISKLN